MIRRHFKYTPAHDEAVDVELLVTYDPDTDVMHVGFREQPYDQWSLPLEQTATDDDQVGRAGGHRYSSDGGVEDAIELMRRVVAEHDARPVIETPNVVPPSE